MKSTYLQIMRRQWKLILSVVIVAVVLSLVLSMLQKPMYRTSAELLIVPKNYGTNDIYTSAKAAEHLALTFSEVVYTNSFMAAALQNNAGVADNFGASALDRKDNWAKMIETKVVSNTGFLQVDAYAPDQQQSSFLAYAITNTLEQQANQYLGQEDSVTVKVIDSPTTYDKVAKPKVTQNVVLGLLLGLVAGIGLALVFPKERELNFFDAIKEIRQQYSSAPAEDIFPSVPAEKVPVEPSGASVPERIPAEVGGQPADLPAGKVEAEREKITVAENEPVELSHEERSDHWLKTGEVKL